MVSVLTRPHAWTLSMKDPHPYPPMSLAVS
jgi:hypothetical protein